MSSPIQMLQPLLFQNKFYRVMRVVLTFLALCLCTSPTFAFLGGLKSLFGSSDTALPGSSEPNTTQDLSDFIYWFKEMGGTINPAVTLASFEDFGNGLSTTKDGSVEELDVLFKASR